MIRYFLLQHLLSSPLLSSPTLSLTITLYYSLDQTSAPSSLMGPRQNCSKYLYSNGKYHMGNVSCVYIHRCTILTFSKYFSPLVYLLVFITYWYSIHSQGIQSLWCLLIQAIITIENLTLETIKKKILCFKCKWLSSQAFNKHYPVTVWIYVRNKKYLTWILKFGFIFKFSLSSFLLEVLWGFGFLDNIDISHFFFLILILHSP